LPHAVPLGCSPAALQTGAPVVQATVPVRHGCPDREQLLPAAHATQAPPLQTKFGPQSVPLAWGCCESVQVATPCEQVVLPT
jgi:hypothetical protein